MKKISLALSFLLFSNINLYAVHFNNDDIDIVSRELDTVEEVLNKHPSGAEFTLNQLQIKYGMCEEFGLVFGKRYNDLKTKIITELKKREQEEKSLEKSLNTLNKLDSTNADSEPEPLTTEDEFINVCFQDIIVSLSNPGDFPHLKKTNLNRGIVLRVNINQNSKDTLERALNEEKESLLKNLISDDQIPFVEINLKDIDVENSYLSSIQSFSTRNDPKLFHKNPLELKLNKLGEVTHSMLSVILINTNK